MTKTGRHLTISLSRSIVALIAALALPLGVQAAPTPQHADALWQTGLDQALHGRFSAAAEALRQLDDGRVVEEVRSWLDAYLEKQKTRAELDKADYEKYVTYAKQRIERKEYALALDKALLAKDVAADENALLQSDWMQQLVKDALAHAEKLREQKKWRDAWHIYADLGALYEREPRYQKLENEVLTHLRLDTMFGEDKHWRERVEKVQWKDAEAALDCIGLYFVEPPDFKAIAEHGLEQLLLLAESKSARKVFEGLQSDTDREDFVNRIKANLDQIRAMPTVDKRTCVDRFKRAVHTINRETVKLPEEVIVSELMRGALEPLDEFTTIIWPKDTDDFDKHTRGDFVGVGISIIKNKANEIEVVTPLEDTPAFRHGIQAGDIIVKVDGVDIKDFSLNKVVDTITGIQGTPVTLTIRRDGKEIEFPLVREKVKIQSVKGWQRRPDGSWNYWLDEQRKIGYVRITNFQRNTVEDFTNVMSELESKGIKGLLLDLRWNPGGLLDSAYQMSSLFLRRGDMVVSTRGRNPHEEQQLPVSSNGPYSSLPLVVLVNESSASASEIVSGALRDNKRAIVIGERTFGKFSVQNLIPLSSSSAKLKITTARYYLPSGVSLHREPDSDKWGVEPDVGLKLARWEAINSWQLRRDADLLGPPKPESAKKDDDKPVDPAKIDPITGEEVSPKKDEPSVDTGKEDKPGIDSKNEEAKDQAKASDAQTPEDEKLPPLEQPDENNRPKEDPQVDTALLIMRLKLLGQSYPTVAALMQAHSVDPEPKVDAKGTAEP